MEVYLHYMLYHLLRLLRPKKLELTQLIKVLWLLKYLPWDVPTKLCRVSDANNKIILKQLAERKVKMQANNPTIAPVQQA